MTVDGETVETAARNSVESGKYASALNAYEKLVADRPRDARILHKLADLHFRMKAFAEAAATYERAGEVYELAGRAENATSAFEQVRSTVLKHAPELRERHARVWTKLATAHLIAHRTKLAVEVLLEICVALESQKREAELEVTLQRIVDLQPREPSHRAALGELQLRTGDPSGAATSLVEAAELFLARGNIKECYVALDKLQICHREAPENLDVLFLVAKSFQALGQRDRSLEVRRQMEQVARDRGESARLEELLRALPAADTDDDDFEVVSDDELLFEDAAPFLSETFVPASEPTDSRVRRDSSVRFSGSEEVESTLETADSLIDWGMLDEARAILREKLSLVPNSTLLRERLLNIEALDIVRPV